MNQKRFIFLIIKERNDRAILLIKKGLAYVDDQTAQQISETRGSLTKPGTPSPYQNRSVEENLSLNLKDGKFKEKSP